MQLLVTYYLNSRLKKWLCIFYFALFFCQNMVAAQASTGQSSFTGAEKAFLQHAINGNHVLHFSQNIARSSSSPQQYLAQHGELTMCVEANRLPIEAMIKGQYVGLAAGFVALFSERISRPITVLETANKADTVAALSEGRCDFVAMMHESPLTQKTLSFSAPYLHFPLALISHHNKQPNTLPQQPQKSLGSQKAAPYNTFLKRLYPDTNIHEYSSITAGLDAVNRGEIDGFIGVLPMMAYQLRWFYPQLKISEQLDYEYAFSVALAKHNRQLQDIFEKLLNSIETQQKQQIINRWLPISPPPKANMLRYKVVILIAFSMLIFSLLLLLSMRNSKVQLQKKWNKLEKIAMRDYLTEAPNLSYFNDQSKKEWLRAIRSQEPIALLIIDIDHFKGFNEQYGRTIGDRYLIELAQRLQSIINRPADLLARFTSDEFIVLLPNTPERGLRAVIDEIIYMVNTGQFVFDNIQAGNRVSISIGATCMTATQAFSEMELERRAKQALYQAQDKGKGQVVIYSSYPTLHQRAS